MKRYENKVVVVTGSTRGIGYGIAERMISEGAMMVISSRKQKAVEKAVAELRNAYPGAKVEGCPCHVGKPEQRKKLIDFAVEKFGKIDVFVSNVAISPASGPLMTSEEKLWDKIFSVNITSAFFAVKEAVPHMPKGSSILFVGSIGGFVPFPLIGVYSISKTAILGLTRCLAEELSAKEIRVNNLAPGVIKTNFSRMIWQKSKGGERLNPALLIKRNGTSEDCAAAAAFLCSDDASYITGETLPVTGGLRSRL